jgi:hypothetical protein
MMDSHNTAIRHLAFMTFHFIMSVVSTFLSTLEREVFPVSAFQTVDYSLIKWPRVARQHFSYKTFDPLTVEHNNSALSQWLLTL